MNIYSNSTQTNRGVFLPITAIKLLAVALSICLVTQEVAFAWPKDPASQPAVLKGGPASDSLFKQQALVAGLTQLLQPLDPPAKIKVTREVMVAAGLLLAPTVSSLAAQTNQVKTETPNIVSPNVLIASVVVWIVIFVGLAYLVWTRSQRFGRLGNHDEILGRVRELRSGGSISPAATSPAGSGVRAKDDNVPTRRVPVEEVKGLPNHEKLLYFFRFMELEFDPEKLKVNRVIAKKDDFASKDITGLSTSGKNVKRVVELLRKGVLTVKEMGSQSGLSEARVRIIESALVRSIQENDSYQLFFFLAQAGPYLDAKNMPSDLRSVMDHFGDAARGVFIAPRAPRMGLARLRRLKNWVTDQLGLAQNHNLLDLLVTPTAQALQGIIAAEQANQDIMTLGLSSTINTKFRRVGIRSWGDLVVHTENSLMQLSVSRDAVRRAQLRLALQGLSLGMRLESPPPLELPLEPSEPTAPFSDEDIPGPSEEGVTAKWIGSGSYDAEFLAEEADRWKAEEIISLVSREQIQRWVREGRILLEKPVRGKNLQATAIKNFIRAIDQLEKDGLGGRTWTLEIVAVGDQNRQVLLEGDASKGQRPLKVASRRFESQGSRDGRFKTLIYVPAGAMHDPQVLLGVLHEIVEQNGKLPHWMTSVHEFLAFKPIDGVPLRLALEIKDAERAGDTEALERLASRRYIDTLITPEQKARIGSGPEWTQALYFAEVAKNAAQAALDRIDNPPSLGDVSASTLSGSGSIRRGPLVLLMIRVIITPLRALIHRLIDIALFRDDRSATQASLLRAA